MNERLSRVLVSLEALLILAPLTLLASFYLAFLLTFLWEVQGLVPWHGYAAPVLAAAAIGCLLCLWKAVLAFVFQGRAGLAGTDRRLVIAISLGSLLAVFGMACMLAAQWPGMPEVLQALGIHAYGAPALVPAAHIALERRHATAHPPIEPSPRRRAA